MTDPLRPYWDFDDPDASEVRFRELIAEVQTLLARIEGLRNVFASGVGLRDDTPALSPRVRIRVDLERGRLRRSSGDAEAALPLFERAFEAAIAAGEEWLAGDAAHMAALAAPDRERRSGWFDRGLELARWSEGAAYWEGPLLNNLGWELFDAKEYDQALEVFERALVVRERDPNNPAAIQLAREAIAETREALGREAI